MAYARVYDEEITRIDVEVEGAPPIPLHVVSGYALGAIPKEAHTLALVGRNADGDEVTRTTLRPAEQPPDQQ
jgi:Ni,Fe-hydrogenase III small subunit